MKQHIGKYSTTTIRKLKVILKKVMMWYYLLSSGMNRGSQKVLSFYKTLLNHQKFSQHKERLELESVKGIRLGWWCYLRSCIQRKKQLLRLHYIFANATNDKVYHYAKKTYGFNTHSLRYAFISYLAKLGVQPQLIAKITQHSKLDMILNYISQITANQILLNIRLR